MIVNYDKKKGFSTLLSGLKQDSASISDEFAKLSIQIKDLPLKDLPNTGNWQKWAESMNYTDKSLLKFLSDVDSGNKSIRDLDTYMQSATQKTTTFQRGMSALKSIGGTLLSAGINMAAIWAVSAAIEGIATSIYNWVNADKIAIEEGQKAQDNIKDRFKEYTNGKKTITDLGKSFVKSTDDIKTTDDAIDSIAKKYTELSKGVNQFTNENNNLSADNYQTYLDTCNQLAEQFPSLVSGYDAQGNAMLNLGSNADSAAQSIRNLYEAQMLSANAEIGQNLQTSFDGVMAQIKQYEQDIANYKVSASTELIDPAFAVDQAKNKQSIELDTKDLGEQTTDYYNQIVESLQKAGLKYQEYTSEYIDTETGKWEQKIGFSMIDGTAEQLQSFYDDIGNKSEKFYNEQIVQKNDYLQKEAATQMMIDDQWKSMSESIGQYLQTSESFTKLDTKIQDAFIGNLANIDLSALSSEYDGQVLPFLYGEFIEPLSKLQPEAQKALSDLFSLDESKLTTSDYYNQVQQALESAFPDDKDMQKKWRDNFGMSDIIKENARETGTLKNMFKDNIAEIDAMTNGEHQIAYDLVINDGFSGTFEELKEAMKASANSSDYSLSSMQEKVTSAQTALSNFSSAISESQSVTGLTADSISTLKEQFQGLTVEGQALEGMDLDALFRNTADGVRLNSDAMENLVEKQREADSKKFADTIKYQNEQLAKQKKEVDELDKKVKEQKASQDEFTAAQEKYNKSRSDLSAIYQAQSQYQALYNQQKDLFSEYNQWVADSQKETAGTPYDNMVDGLDEAYKALKKGLVGTDNFKSFAKMLSPTGATDPADFAENYAKAARYLKDGDKGVKNFLKDLQTKKLADYNEQTKQWTINAHNAAEASKALGTGESVVTAILGKLEDYGAHINTVNDVEEGVMKLSDAYINLAESQAKLDEMNANPNDYSAVRIKAQEEEVKAYQQDIEDITDNMEYYIQHSADQYNTQIENAKKASKYLADYREEILRTNKYGDNTEAIANSLENEIRNYESTYGLEPIELTATVDIQAQAQAYRDALKNASIENPVAPDFGSDTQAAENYASAVSKIQDANENNKSSLQQYTDVLSQFNTEQIKSIDLFDGAYDSEELKPAEQAMDGLIKSFGLTKEEASGLWQVLESMGIIKPEVDDSAVKQAKEDVEETRQTYENLDGSTVSIEADVSGTEQAEALKEACSNIPQGMQTTITANVSGSEQMQSLEEGLEQIPDNTPTTVDVTVDNAQDLETLQGKVDSLNANGKQITLNATVKKVDTTDVLAESSNPIEITGTIKEIEPYSGEPPEVEVTGIIKDVQPSGSTNVNIEAESSTKELEVNAKVNHQEVDDYQPDNKEADVIFGKDSSKPDNYQPDDKSAMTIYGLDASAINNWQPPDKHANVIYTDIHQSSSGRTHTGSQSDFYTGTMTSIAHADGTMHNAPWNYQSLTSSYANGKVSLPKDEKALVNELGQESIIRNGVWSLIPGKMHVENLKKGDIILNAKQTADLLKFGKTNSHARAYAEGTVTNGTSIAPSYALGNVTFVQDQPYVKNLTKPQSDNTKATNDNTSATQSNTEATKESTEVFDWVKTKLDKFAKAVETIGNKITDYISIPLKNLYLKRQINALGKEISANRTAYDIYMKQAESIDIPDNYKKLVQNGEFKVEEIDTSTDEGKKLAENIKKYEEYYNKVLDCSDAIQELNNKHIELYETLVNLPIEQTEKKIEKLENRMKSLTSFMSTISSGGSAISALKNIVDADNPDIQKIQDAYKTTKATVESTKKTRVTTARAYKTAKADYMESGTALSQAVQKQTDSAVKTLKNATKNSTSKATYSAIVKAIKNSQPVSLKGLKGTDLEAAKKYNNSLKQEQYVVGHVAGRQNVSTAGLSKNIKALAKEWNADNRAMQSATKEYEKAVGVNEKAKEDFAKAQSDKKSLDRSTTSEQRSLANLDTSKKSYVLQNKWLDEEIKILEEQNKQYLSAVKKTIKTADKELANRDKKQKDLLNNKKFIKALTDDQLKAIKNGEQMDLDGLVGDNVKIGEQWNKTVQKTTLALEAQTTAVQNLTESESTLAEKLIENEKKKLENISNYYDSMMAQFETKNSLIQTYMNRMETRGYNLSTSFYEAQIANQKQIANKQKAELAAMQKSFQDALDNDRIQVGTQEYYEMKDTIDQLTLSIAETTNNIVELQASIRDLEWEQFDRLQESIKRVASESDFLIDLMSSKELYDKKTGLLTDAGWATMGLHGVNYNTYMAQADKYKEEMLKISAELANDPNNQKLIDRKNELIDAQQQAILAAENEKKSIRDMVENGIDIELDAIDDLIDKYLDALEAKKSLWEYEKKIQKQAESIASLQKQLAVYQNDNSEEARAKIQEIKVNLKDAQDDLKEAEYDKFISDQKELLESLRNDYEEVLNKRLDNIDVLIQTSIDQINANAENIQATLTEQATNVGYELSTEMKTIWTHTDGVKDVLSTYSEDFTDKSTTFNDTLGNIYNRQKEMIDAIKDMAEKYIKKVDEITQSPVISSLEEGTEKVKVETVDANDKNTLGGSTTGKVNKNDLNNTGGSGGATLSGGTSSGSGGNKNNSPNDNSNIWKGIAKDNSMKGDKSLDIDTSIYDRIAYNGYKTGFASQKQLYANLKGSGTYTGTAEQNTWMIKQLKLKGYASGGHVDKDQWAFVNENGQELIRYNGATLLPLPSGADIWNAPETKALLDKMSNPQPLYYDYTSQLLKSLKNVGGNGNSESIQANCEVVFNLPNVKSYPEFMNQMVHDPKFEKLINAITIDKVHGGSNHGKYRVIWKE